MINMKKKWQWIALSVIMIVFSTRFIISLSRDTEVKELDCYTSSSESNLRRVFLIDHMPLTVEGFNSFVRDSLSKIPRNQTIKSETFLFVKETNHNLINKYLWGDKGAYSKCNIDLNDIDFLGKIVFSNSGDTTIKIYSGRLYHY